MAARLKELRTAQKMTQVQLGKLSGVPQNHISRLERREGWTFQHLEALAAAFGLSVAEFLAGAPGASAAPTPSAGLSAFERLLIRTLRDDGPKGAAFLLMSYMQSLPLPDDD